MDVLVVQMVDEFSGQWLGKLKHCSNSWLNRLAYCSCIPGLLTMAWDEYLFYCVPSFILTSYTTKPTLSKWHNSTAFLLKYLCDIRIQGAGRRSAASLEIERKRVVIEWHPLRVKLNSTAEEMVKLCFALEMQKESCLYREMKSHSGTCSGYTCVCSWGSCSFVYVA